MRGITSSAAYDSATRSENCESTSYGVARLPYTSRLATRCTRSRTGWNPTATIAVARIDSPRLGLPPPPTSAPMPTAMPTYTAVMNTASEPYTRVRLMTTSMSYSRYLKIAIADGHGECQPEAEDDREVERPARQDWNRPGRRITTIAATVTSTAYAIHFSCWRSSPLARRIRSSGATPATEQDGETEEPDHATAAALPGRAAGTREAQRVVQAGVVGATGAEFNGPGANAVTTTSTAVSTAPATSRPPPAWRRQVAVGKTARGASVNGARREDRHRHEAAEPLGPDGAGHDPGA